VNGGERKRLPGRWILGLILVGLGVLFLLANAFEDFDVGDFFATFWPLILIIVGGALTLSSRGRNVVGLVLLLLGVGFQAAQLDWISDDWIGQWGWPLILIVVGLWFILFRPLSREARGQASGDDWFDAFGMFGERKVHVTSRAWRGGEATAVMGSVEIDLRDAFPIEKGAKLEVTAFMGGVEVFVPRTWVVVVKGVPILGSVEDRTVVSADTDETRSPSPELPRLEVHGTAIMGSVEIKHPS
jgi:Cell wall-active antibiotics response 4TMS YvqF/Domain of unknown function (DUF5668)